MSMRVFDLDVDSSDVGLQEAQNVWHLRNSGIHR